MKEMNKSIGFGCALLVAGVTFAQSAATTTTIAPAQAPAAATATAPATAPAATQQPAQQELKVAPGAVLCVWKEKNIAEAELCMIVDSGKLFTDVAADSDESARMVRERTLKWSGILNVDQPGLYTFNGVTHCGRHEGTAVLKINGVEVFSFNGSGVVSKNVQLPGPVNVELVMYCAGRARLTSDGGGMRLKLRYKKAGTLTYKEITPADLFHGAE